jgi:hypothetical protein
MQVGNGGWVGTDAELARCFADLGFITGRQSEAQRYGSIQGVRTKRNFGHRLKIRFVDSPHNNLQKSLALLIKECWNRESCHEEPSSLRGLDPLISYKGRRFLPGRLKNPFNRKV